MRDIGGSRVMGIVMVIMAQPVMTAAGPIARPVAFDLSPDGSTLFIVHHDADVLVAVSTQAGNVTAQVPAGVAPSDVAVVPSLDEVWTISRYESVLRRFDASSLLELASIDVPPYCERISAHPDGTKVLVTNSFENSLLVVDTASLQVAAHIDVSAVAGGLLRAHVRERALDLADVVFGERERHVGVGRARQTEVENVRGAALVHENVGRF